MSVPETERPTFWNPQEVGDQIVGTVTSVQAHGRANWGYPVDPDLQDWEKLVYQVTVDEQDPILLKTTGVVTDVWSWATTLHAGMHRERPQVGDVIRCKLTGYGTSRKYGKPYPIIDVRVLNRPPQPFDWETGAPANPTPPLPKAPAAPELPPADDDSVPF